MLTPDRDVDVRGLGASPERGDANHDHTSRYIWGDVGADAQSGAADPAVLGKANWAS
jgi:hypothetical protein